MGVFETLVAMNVNDKTEKKSTGGKALTYLSWPWAWEYVKKNYPDASYEVKMFDGLPYVYDPNTGYMVFTSVTIEGETLDMFLPVMDGANKAMRAAPYTYKVRDYKTKEYVEKIVAAATMFDINKTIMRCLVKNLAMFGLGLYIYAGEDLPTPPAETVEELDRPAGPPVKYKREIEKKAEEIEVLLNSGSAERMTVYNKALDYYKVDKVVDLSVKDAEAIIKRLKETP